ncbi:hypothetical protein [Halopseudomonas sp.]|uniref:hypothetical protein n=1 Tax=Halopseudomonas sp. TaxID=2901191 RepID=UPI0031204BAD
MSEKRRPLTAEEKAECAALKEAFLAWNQPLPRKDRISQEMMAAHLKMNQGSFSNYLNGHRPLHMGIAIGVYELMGIPVETYSKRLAKEIRRLGEYAAHRSEDDEHQSHDPSYRAASPETGERVDEKSRQYMNNPSLISAGAALMGQVTPRSQAVIERIVALEADGKLTPDDLEALEKIIERFGASR